VRIFWIVCVCTFFVCLFGIALQLRSTKVFCDNSEETTLCHCKICVLMLDAARKTYIFCVFNTSINLLSSFYLSVRPIKIMWKPITTLIDVHVECCQLILLIYSLFIILHTLPKTHIMRRDIWPLMDVHCDVTLQQSILTHDKDSQQNVMIDTAIKIALCTLLFTNYFHFCWRHIMEIILLVHTAALIHFEFLFNERMLEDKIVS
jgi:hypothetical protein